MMASVKNYKAMTLDGPSDDRIQDTGVGVSARSYRLSTPTPLRVGGAITGAFVVGALLGVSHGSKMSGMRFRAENSHRFPTTSTGWYLYHKTKNYHVMLGGIKEGLKMGFKTSFWTGGFFVIENTIDNLRHRQDCLSSTVAGLTVAGNFAWFSKPPSNDRARGEELMKEL